ncbi:S8 family serine peptidase [Motilibacter aurantiacus]|uniref:S8 family serine peptidase n=1 Tax=Motilibacter aurantiacus TaxID=2714955 RepID=UPI002F2B5064
MPRRGATLAASAVAAAVAIGGLPAQAAQPAVVQGPPAAVTAAEAASAGAGNGWLAGQWGDDDTREDEKASRATGAWTASGDQGSLWTITQQLGAQHEWGKRITGAGVDVALIDTGVTPVAGLSIPGKVVNGPDLSFDSQSGGTRSLDGYGHGTHMAGIIAGVDTSLPSNGDKPFVGVAPGARIVNVKVGAADGGVDVSQVIAGIDWVVQHRRDHGLNIRVINLSYGTSSQQSYLLDPLARAVENAWRAGIVVVAAAGNDGAASTSLTMPAVDPFVLAVGATDHQGTAALKDDRVADFTNPGTDARRPDLVAPGKSVVSLRVPGSVADVDHPEGLVTGDETGRFFRGSGTSQATAVVSGAVALLLQQNPQLTPDQVKRVLQITADKLPAEPSPAQGAGLLDIDGAVSAGVPSAASSQQAYQQSTGLGSLEASRGDSHVVDPETNAVLSGEVDALGGEWDGRRWSAQSFAGQAWSGGTWNGRRWSGAGWSGTGWESVQWTGANWTGIDWQGRRWSEMNWDGRRWSGRRWSGDEWAGRRWSGRRWSGADWTASSSAPAAVVPTQEVPTDVVIAVAIEPVTPDPDAEAVPADVPTPTADDGTTAPSDAPEAGAGF